MLAFATAQPALFAFLYLLTLLAIVFMVVGVQHEKTRRDTAWANAETTETEAKVQVAAMDLEKVKTLAAAHEQFHATENFPPIGIVR